MNKVDEIIDDAIFYEANSILKNILSLHEGGQADEESDQVIWSKFDQILEMYRKRPQELSEIMTQLEKRYGHILDVAEKNEKVKEKIVDWLCAEEAWQPSRIEFQKLARQMWKDKRVVVCRKTCKNK